MENLSTLSQVKIDPQKVKKFFNEPFDKIRDVLEQLYKRKTVFDETQVKLLDPVDYVNSLPNPDDTYVVTVLRITSEISGSLFLLFSAEDASSLAQLVTAKYEQNLLSELSALEISAIKETANIIFGSLLTSFSARNDVNYLYSIPDYTKDMVRAVLDQFCAEIKVTGAYVLSVTSNFKVQSQGITGQILMLFDSNSFSKVLEANDRSSS